MRATPSIAATGNPSSRPCRPHSAASTAQIAIAPSGERSSRHCPQRTMAMLTFHRKERAMLFISIIGVVAIVAGFATLMVLAYRSEDQEFHHPEQNPGELHHHGSVWLRRSDI